MGKPQSYIFIDPKQFVRNSIFTNMNKEIPPTKNKYECFINIYGLFICCLLIYLP